MKYKGTIVETLVIAKTVEVEVPDGADEDKVRELLENKAYENRLEEGAGWEFVDSETPEVESIEKVPA